MQESEITVKVLEDWQTINEKLNEMINRVKNLGLNLDNDFFVKKVELKYKS